MSFGAEMKDFISGFNTGADIVDNIKTRRAERDKTRKPTDKDLGAIPDYEGGDTSVDEYVPPSDETTTSSTDSGVDFTGDAKPGEIESYIREAASVRNIDPNIAVRVAKSEGGVNDPTRQSQVVKGGKRERSYGPFQLYIDGGLGNQALKAGIDPRNPKQWRESIDFALDHAQKNGWGAWYGAAKVGVDDWEGIGKYTGIGGPRRKPSTPSSSASANTQAKAEPVIPEDEGVDFASLSGISGGGGGGGGTERKSKRDREPLPEAVLPDITDWTEWEKRNRATFARKGGMIERYADGGTVDPYNSSRVFTQVNEESNSGTTGSTTGSTSGTAAAVGGTSSWKPRRVGEPTSTAAATSSVKDPTTGLTSSQQAWRDALAKLETDRAAAAAVPATNTNPYNLTRLQEYDALMQYMYDRAQPSTRTISGGNDAGDENTVTSVNKVAQDRYNELRKGKEAYLAGTDPSWAEGWLTEYRSDPGETWGRLYSRGGTVQGYASGGMVRGVVTVDPDYWEAAIERESKGGGDEQEIRDRAAKRINRAQRGVESSAIRVGKRGQQAVDAGRQRAASRTPATAPVPSGRPVRLPETAALPATRPAGGAQVAIAEDRATRERQPVVIAEDRATRDRSGAPPVVLAEDRATRERRGTPPVLTTASAPDVDTRPGRPADEALQPSVRDTPVDRPGISRNPYDTARRSAPPGVYDPLGRPGETGIPMVAVDLPGEYMAVPPPGSVAEPVQPGAVPTGEGVDWRRLGAGVREALSRPGGDYSPVPPVPAGGSWFGSEVIPSTVEEDRAARQRQIVRPPMVVGSPGLKRGDPGEVVLSDPPRNPITTPDDRATREGRMPAGGGGWMGRAAPPIRRATPQEEAMAPPANQMVVRPPVPMGGRVDLSGPAAPFRGGYIQMNDGRIMMWQQDGTLVPAMPPVDPGAMYARGGVIPEEDEPLGGRRPEQYAPPASNPPPRIQTGPGQNTAREWPVDETPQYENVKPTKKLRDHVAQALDGGAKFLTRHFGLKDDGAVRDPGQGLNDEKAAMRMARGEGAATPEEINGIDDKIDPGRRLDEGDRHMTRLAKMTQWYLEQGRKEDAEASAASLMMYGSRRFSQLGQLAATGYRKYQQTGNPEDLRKTTQYLEQAYKLIPDGSKLDVSLNPETQTLQVTRLLPDGQEVTHDLTAEQLGGVVRQATNTSTYWQQIFRLADPQGARDIATERRQEKRDIRTEQRQDRLADRREQVAYDRETRRNENLRAYEERKAGRTEEGLDRRERERIAAEDRREAARLKAEERAAKVEEMRFQRRNPQVDWDVVNPLRAEVQAAEVALADDDSPEAEARYNQAASRMFDALTDMSKEPAKVMRDLNIEGYTYIAPEAAAPGPPPAKYPDAKWVRNPKTGQMIWAVQRNGQAFQVPQ